MSRTLKLVTLVSLFSGAAFANDPATTPPPSTKEVIKAEEKDDKTAVALAALDEALKRNSKESFDTSASQAIDTLQARKSAISNKTAADAVDPDIKKAKDTIDSIKKSSDAEWKNLGMQLKVQLQSIDKRLDDAEVGKATAPTPPATGTGTGYPK